MPSIPPALSVSNSTELFQEAFLFGFSGSCTCPPCGDFFGVFRLSRRWSRDWNWCRRCHSLQPLCRLCLGVHPGTLCRCRLIGLHLDTYHPYYAHHVQIGSAAVWLAPRSLQQELLQTAVDDYYNAAAEAGLTPSLGRDPGKFELVDGRIRLKAYPNLDLINKRSGRPLALSTLASRGGIKAIREDLGFANWSQTRKTLSANGERALQQAVDSLPAGGENIPPEELSSVVQEAIAGAEMATTALDEELTSEQTAALATIDDPPLDVQWVGQANRELRGLKLAMTRKQDELVNNLAKLSELDDEIPGIKDHIARERTKLTETEDEGLQQEIQKITGSLPSNGSWQTKSWRGRPGSRQPASSKRNFAASYRESARPWLAS